MHRCALLQSHLIQIVLQHFPAHDAADPVQHRLAPRECFRAAVLIAFLAVTIKFNHHVFSTEAEWVGYTLTDNRHELSQVRSESITITATLDAGVYSNLQLLIGER